MTSTTAVMIEDEIRRLTETRAVHRTSLRMKFAPPLEIVHEAETKTTRVSESRVTILMGIGFYLSTSLTDPVFLPDIGNAGLALRLCAVIPPALTLVVASRVTARTFEVLITLAAIVAVITLGIVTSLSSAPLAPYSFATVYLAMTYANTTLPLRFHLASCCTVVCSVALMGFIGSHPLISTELVAAMALQILNAAFFSLFASFRIERSGRLAYLLAKREALRLSDLAADREVLTVLSSTDALTGLANRGHFDRYIAELMESPASRGQGLGLLMVDVDYFKRYNDFYGHVAGDACLRAVADTLADMVRGKDDLAARFGGEEFAILLFGVTEAQAQSMASLVCEAVAAGGLPHADRDDRLGLVTISIGVAATILGDGESIDAFVARADSALYAAKRSGRNRAERCLGLAA